MSILKPYQIRNTWITESLIFSFVSSSIHVLPCWYPCWYSHVPYVTCYIVWWLFCVNLHDNVFFIGITSLIVNCNCRRQTIFILLQHLLNPGQFSIDHRQVFDTIAAPILIFWRHMDFLAPWNIDMTVYLTDKLCQWITPVLDNWNILDIN